MRSESGLSHIGLIVAGIIAVSALLGVVFYHNFIAEKQNATSQQNENTSLPTEKISVSFGAVRYSLDYPKGWSAEKSIERDDVVDQDDDTPSSPESEAVPTTASMKLQSPSSSIEIIVRASARYENNKECNPSESQRISHYTVYEEMPNTEFASSSTYLVEVLYDAKNGGYEHVIGLTPDGGETNSVVGQSWCNVQNVGMSGALLRSDDESITQPFLSARIILTQYKNEPMREMQLGRDIFASEDYAQARQILESLRKE